MGFKIDKRSAQDRILNQFDRVLKNEKWEKQNDLKTQLGEVNNKVSQLAGLINELKTKSDDFERQVGLYTKSIGDKQSELEELKQKIANTNAEKEQINTQFNNDKNAKQIQIDEQQVKINRYEEQLRDLTQQKQAAENQAEALQNELQGKGDQQAIHSEEIRQLTEKSEKQLQEQSELLIKRIEECEQKIQ